MTFTQERSVKALLARLEDAMGGTAGGVATRPSEPEHTVACSDGEGKHITWEQLVQVCLGRAQEARRRCLEERRRSSALPAQALIREAKRKSSALSSAPKSAPPPTQVFLPAFNPDAFERLPTSSNAAPTGGKEGKGIHSVGEGSG